MPAKRTPSTPVYQLTVTLRDIRPPIWRQVQVPARVRLPCLHDVLQIAMGWTDSHLHEFEKDGILYGIPGDDDDGYYPVDSSGISLDSLLQAEGDSLLYHYDFGDNWRHDVVVEKILPADDAAIRPRCVAGARHCPPEDVGGVHGYEEFLEVIFDPGHEEHQRMVTWVGERFQPEEFDLAEVNKRLSRMRWPVRCYR